MKMIAHACSYLFDIYGGCENCSHQLCCKIYAPIIGGDEVKRIARFTHNKPDEFKEKYLYDIPVEFSNGIKKLRYMLNQIPCPFHKEGKCSIYPVRPSSCKQFPFQCGPFVLLEGIEVCPTATLMAEGIREFLEQPDIKSDIVFEVRNNSGNKVEEDENAIKQQMEDMKSIHDPLDKKYKDMGIDNITSQSFTDRYEMHEFLLFLESKGLVGVRK
jgi:Fe-S-cluster containining protein